MKKDTTKVAVGDALTPETLADLERSGLTRKDAQRMLVRSVTAEWCDAALGIPRAGYRMPYLDMDGKATEFYRVRFTEFPPSGGKFGTPLKQPVRYAQPEGTRPYIYFPPLVGSAADDWRKIAADTSQVIVFTEGEKKAAAACNHGFNCLGLGGVWSFKSNARGWSLLPEFADIDFKGRRVEICYDSDVMTKQQVHAALTELTARLIELGATVDLVYLVPQPGERKQALDDLLVAHGAEGFNALPRETSQQTRAFNILNNRAVYLRDQGMFWDLDERVLMDTAHARLTLAPLATILETKGGKTPVTVPIPAFDKWVLSPARRGARKLAYEPGTFETTLPDQSINVWVAPEIRPKRGAVKLWLDFVHYLFRTPEQAEWFLKWLAYPVQRPGTKMLQAVFVYSDGQGVGKTFAVEPLMRFIYGDDNFTNLSNADLHSAFNGQLANKQFAVLNEIYIDNARERRDLMANIKDMVTREQMVVNRKYAQPYVMRDCVNYYVTSNHADALAIEPEDRRFFVVEAPTEALPESTYTELDAWLRNPTDPSKSGPGASAILYHLLHRIDTTDFNPKRAAMQTNARETTVRASMSHVNEFALRLAEYPDELIPNAFRDLYTPADLLRIFRDNYPNVGTPTVTALGNALRTIDLPKFRGRQRNGAPLVTLYALRNQSKWRAAPGNAWLTYHFTDVNSNGS